MQIQINKEYENLIPSLSEEEYQSLKQSIEQYGQQIPIIVNINGVVLDGHHRFKACEELGIIPKTEVKHFSDLLYEKLFVIDSNLERRQLNKFQRIELELIREPLLKEIAKRNQGTRTDISQDPVKSLGRQGVNEEIGNRTNSSHETVRRVKKIKESGNEDLIQKTREGKASIEYAYKSVTRSEDHKNTPQLPEGQFDIILADPPWSYDFNIRGSPDDHYQVMTNKDIEDLQVPAAENAILFLWATFPKLPEAINVLKRWGFRYKTGAAWFKDKIGTGYYFRGQVELLLIGEKGDMPVPEESNRPSQEIREPRREHSQKPEIYEMIQRMYPNRKYIELFARNSSKEGWISWGNESD